MYITQVYVHQHTVAAKMCYEVGAGVDINFCTSLRLSAHALKSSDMRVNAFRPLRRMATTDVLVAYQK